MTDNEKTKTELVMENVHLRRKLDEAEARAERMEKRYKGQLAHSEELELAVKARKAELKERGEAIRRLEEERVKLTEKERRVLEMWPRFEDGELVWFGDELYFGEDVQAAKELHIEENGFCIEDKYGYIEGFGAGERVERPAPEVLDADGVPINVGDTVRHVKTGVKFTVAEVSDGGLLRFEETDGVFLAPDMLTHRLMDGWEKLLRDAHEIIKREFPADMRDKLDDFIDDTVFHARGIAEVER